ncbi:hypothetical protein RUE5091_00862 [Ruegeria denitrificans]|uniref:Uncharacterized protein n=1 Tax=Ruegeria denitrificans TaxID=1715692 RepID=A0A0P1I4J0_9RHOB|nr:hypothetical protein [Ruegeria denitrificans]CUJ89373.1 hypothetical protein RUE5091_00862 [Ruegeria denitrificans]
MTPKHSYHGGLQFDGETDGAIERFGTIVATTLEDYGHLIERKNMISDTEASVVSSQYLVRLTLDTHVIGTEDRFERLDRAAGLKTAHRPIVTLPKNRLTITISPVSALLDDSEISELMLVVILYRMVDICSTQRVEWLSPNTVLTIEQFMSAFDTLTPSKSRNRKQIFEAVTGPFAGLAIPEAEDLDEPQKQALKPAARPIQLSDEQLLSIAFRTEPIEQPMDRDDDTPPLVHDKPSDILRLSSWGLTGAVASVSVPIAVSLAAVNLIRGEDFRLNTQVLAYSVAISALSTSGAIAGVANAIGM